MKWALATGQARNITLKSANGPLNCIIDCNGSDASPCRGFDFNGEETYGNHRETRAAVVDGFTIKNGYIKSLGTHQIGAGVRVILSSPTIKNCIIENNSAPKGGGVAIEGKSDPEYITEPCIEGCTIKSNQARTINTGSGGGIFAEFNADADIINTLIGPLNTAGGDGGGLYWIASDIQIHNCMIFENAAKRGAGIFATNNEGFPERPSWIRSSVVRRNSATDGGGGAWLEGGTIQWIVNCHFLGNKATAVNSSGGGIRISGPTSGNGVKAKIVNCKIVGNKAPFGGGLFVNEKVETGPEGSEITDSTVANNEATLAGGTGGIRRGPMASGDPVFRVRNSIVWGNTNGQLYEAVLDKLEVRYTDVAGGWTGTGNKNQDPIFRRTPSPGSGGWGSSDDDYGDLHVGADSSVINGGSNSLEPISKLILL